MVSHKAGGWGLSSFEPSQGADEVDACEEISGGLFVAGCDGAKVLDVVEETFHEVALAIESAKSHSRGVLRFALGGMTGLMLRTKEMLDEAVATIAFVGEEGCGFDFLGLKAWACVT